MCWNMGPENCIRSFEELLIQSLKDYVLRKTVIKQYALGLILRYQISLKNALTFLGIWSKLGHKN